MEIDRIAVVLRPRGSHEAMDLGTALLRRYARRIYAAWFPLTLPVLAIALALLSFDHRVWPSLLLLWWLKPLFARVPLFVVSRAVFAEAPDWRTTLRGVFAWGATGMPGWLTLGRFDARRGVRQPLVYLEGLSRSERARRWRVFGRNLDGVAYTSTFGCLVFEVVVVASLLLLVPLFVPRELWSDGWFERLRWGVMPPGFRSGVVVAYYLAISITEPLYTAGGFALYLSRRTDLEAWDIDLSFRRLRDRLLSAGTAALFVFAVLAAPLPAHAAEAKSATPTVALDSALAPPPAAVERRGMQDVSKVFADPRFGGVSKRMGWGVRDRYRSKPEPPADRPVERVEAPEAGGIVKTLLIGILAMAAIGIAWFVMKRAGHGVAAGAASPAIRPSAVTLSVADPMTPSRLADAVLVLWRKGERRDALALLYRGTVERMAHRLDTPLHPEATEADALAQARLLDDDEASRRVVRIVRTWQYAAYADRYPSDDDLTKLVAGWPAEAS